MIRNMQGFRDIAAMGLQTGPSGFGGLGAVRHRRPVSRLSPAQVSTQEARLRAKALTTVLSAKAQKRLTKLQGRITDLTTPSTTGPGSTPLAAGWYNGSYWDGSTWTTPPAGNGTGGSGSGGGGSGGGGDSGTSDDALTFSEQGSSEQSAGDDKLFTGPDGTALKLDPATGKLVPAANEAGIFNLKTMLVVGAIALILVKLSKKKGASSNWTYAR